jgi:hypothetical protein
MFSILACTVLIGVSAVLSPLAGAFHDDGCFQPACPVLNVQLREPSTTMIADQFETISVVVTNGATNQGAEVFIGTRLLRIDFSRPVAARQLSQGLPAGYSCDQELPPVTILNCTATADDFIAAGASRTFGIQIDAPENLRHQSSDSPLHVTVRLDPDEAIANSADAREQDEAHFSIRPSTLNSLAWAIQDQAIDSKRILDSSSLACSGTKQFDDFRHAGGSMTCSVSLHPATQQTGPITIAPKTSVLSIDVDGPRFRSLVSTAEFSCFGFTTAVVEDAAASNSTVINCEARKSIAFAPGEERQLLLFSMWMPPFPPGNIGIMDWGFCPFLAGGGGCDGDAFGGSAGD